MPHRIKFTGNSQYVQNQEILDALNHSGLEYDYVDSFEPLSLSIGDCTYYGTNNILEAITTAAAQTKSPPPQGQKRIVYYYNPSYNEDQEILDLLAAFFDPTDYSIAQSDAGLILSIDDIHYINEALFPALDEEFAQAQLAKFRGVPRSQITSSADIADEEYEPLAFFSILPGGSDPKVYQKTMLRIDALDRIRWKENARRLDEIIQSLSSQ